MREIVMATQLASFTTGSAVPCLLNALWAIQHVDLQAQTWQTPRPCGSDLGPRFPYRTWRKQAAHPKYCVHANRPCGSHLAQHWHTLALDWHSLAPKWQLLALRHRLCILSKNDSVP